MTRTTGFSLLEMAVATLLLGMAVSGLVALTADSLRAVRNAREYDRAAEAARNSMNDILVLSPLPVRRELRGTHGRRYSWTAVAEPAEGIGDEGGVEGLVRIRMRLWWDSGGERRTMSLETYRRRRVE